MSTSPAPPTYAEAVGAWAAHLRAGGSTPWLAWRDGPRRAPGTGPAATGPGATTRPLPDAAHLELARRLSGRADEPVPGLVDLVLATPSPGRGRVDVPLPWTATGDAGTEGPRFGHPPMDPAQVPAEELVRLAVGVLARLLPGVPAAPATPELTRWPVPWRRRFRLHGSPGTVAAVRRALLAQGLVETDWRPTHLVLARPLAEMMAEHWAASVVSGSALRWGTLWERARARDALPAQLDVERTARRIAASADGRREPVHLVVARDDAEVAAGVAAVVGARAFDVHTRTDPARVDQVRRLNRHTAVLHGAARVRPLAERLVHVLDDGRPPLHAAPPAPPGVALPWARRTARETAARVHGDASRAGYAVHGDLEVLAPTGSAQGSVDPLGTLDQALWGCLEAWRRQEGSR